MKNFNAKLFGALRSLHRDTQTRFLITGTPLQNTLQELWSLLHFLLPKIFDDWQTFEIWFDFSEDLADEKGTKALIEDEEKQGYVQKIHRILQPLLLRRVKADVAAYLPKKREYVLYAPMTKEQTELYNCFQDSGTDSRAFLEQKVAERLTSNLAVSKGPSTPLRKAVAKRKIKTEELPTPTKSLPIRSSPRKAASTAEATKAPVSAFDKMMPKRAAGRPPKEKPAPAPAKPAKPAQKRKDHPTEDDTDSKSARSSRNSTPSVSGRATRRAQKGRPKYTEADDEEDLLDDDAFEQKLASELTSDTTETTTDDDVNSEEAQRLKTLQLAKQEVSKKKLGNPIMQLRLVCNSPHNFYDPWDPAKGVAVDESIVTSSGKMLLLDRLLPDLFRRGHKVLIFSQFKLQLDILQDYCDLRDWSCCRIDGSVAQSDRAWQIAEFNRNPEYRVFLLSTRAGGQGINLAAADTVILFDS